MMSSEDGRNGSAGWQIYPKPSPSPQVADRWITSPITQAIEADPSHETSHTFF